MQSLLQNVSSLKTCSLYLSNIQLQLNNFMPNKIIKTLSLPCLHDQPLIMLISNCRWSTPSQTWTHIIGLYLARCFIYNQSGVITKVTFLTSSPTTRQRSSWAIAVPLILIVSVLAMSLPRESLSIAYPPLLSSVLLILSAASQDCNIESVRIAAQIFS